jgi:hypothetical protein
MVIFIQTNKDHKLTYFNMLTPYLSWLGSDNTKIGYID